MRRKRGALLACVLAAAVPAPSLQGQDARRADPGDFGISASLPSGGGAGLGLRWVAAESVNLGVTVLGDARWADSENQGGRREDDSYRIGIRPDLRLYLSSGDRIVPFFSAAVELSWARSRSENPSSTPNPQEQETRASAMAADIGAGAEWFPVASVGVSASTGLRAVRSENAIYLDGQEEGSSSSATVALFRSELALTLYF